MPPARFETGIPASEQPQTHASDGATTGIGKIVCSVLKNEYTLLN